MYLTNRAVGCLPWSGRSRGLRAGHAFARNLRKPVRGFAANPSFLQAVSVAYPNRRIFGATLRYLTAAAMRWGWLSAVTNATIPGQLGQNGPHSLSREGRPVVDQLPEWARCGGNGCIGVRLPTTSLCLAHAAEQAPDAFNTEGGEMRRPRIP